MSAAPSRAQETPAVMDRRALSALRVARRNVLDGPQLAGGMSGYLGDVPPAEYEETFYARSRTDQSLVGIQ